MVVKPMVHHLLDNQIDVILASRTKAKADKVLDYGNQNYTSIARTVALPAAIAVMLILQGKIKDTGVHIPIKKTIYKPVLAELAGLGISMTESIEQAPSD